MRILYVTVQTLSHKQSIICLIKSLTPAKAMHFNFRLFKILKLLKPRRKVMKTRTNELYSHVVNKSLIMVKFRGPEQAMHMMVKAGLPRNVINRVLDKTAEVRISDWK